MKRNFFLLLILSLTIFSCGDDPQRNSSDLEAKQLLDRSVSLEQNINRNFILASSSPGATQDLKTILSQVTLHLKELSFNPQSKDALLGLHQLTLKYGNLQVLAQDRPIFDSFFSDLRVKAEKLALQMGINLEEMSWKLYSYGFTNGVFPFSTYATSYSWLTDSKLDEYFIAAKANKQTNKAWLLTPGFNLEGIKRPTFRFKHAININDNDQNFDRQQILSQAFKVYVSTTYKSGNPGTPNAADWTEVSILPLPSGHNFHSVYTPEIDLSPFIGERVTIGVYLDFNADLLGGHFITWQLNRFELSGIGNLPTPQAPPLPLYEHLFNKKELAPFTNFSPEQSAAWSAAGTSPTSFKFAKISTKFKASNSWLLSPIIDTSHSEKLSLTLKETVKTNKVKPEGLRVWVLPSYQEGQDPNLLEKTELLHMPSTPMSTSNWNDFTTTDISLEAFKNQKIVLGFQFNPATEDDLLWEIWSVTLYGYGKPLSVTPLGGKR